VERRDAIEYNYGSALPFAVLDPFLLGLTLLKAAIGSYDYIKPLFEEEE
jgi:hypothetical protein